MPTERRQRRSAQPIAALSLYLESLAGRQHWDAVALADDDGLLLGGSGNGIDPEGIAAVAPVAARGVTHAPDGLLGLVTRGRPLKVWGVTVDGHSCHLVTVGNPAPPPTETWTDVGRILKARCAGVAA